MSGNSREKDKRVGNDPSLICPHLSTSAIFSIIYILFIIYYYVIYLIYI